MIRMDKAVVLVLAVFVLLVGMPAESVVGLQENTQARKIINGKRAQILRNTESAISDVYFAYKEDGLDKAKKQAKDGNRVSIVDSKVRVILEFSNYNASVREDLLRLGVELRGSESADFMGAYIPISRIELISKQDYIKQIRRTRDVEPSAISQGVVSINAKRFYDSGHRGAGVKIAVLDLGFKGYKSRLGTELPSNVEIKSFREDNDIEAGEDHGTSCAEIIFDVAPQTELILVNAETEDEFRDAIYWLRAEGVDIISSSLISHGWGSYDGTSWISQTIDLLRQNGILWVNGAGNDALTHYENLFSDPDANGTHNFVDTREMLTFTAKPGAFHVTLTWDDLWGSSSNDYDLILYDSDGNFLAASLTSQDGDDNPIEAIEYSNSSRRSQKFKLGVKTFKTSTQLRNIEIFSSHGSTALSAPDQVVDGSIPNWADAAGALTVGAVSAKKRGGYSATLEDYSSRGPTNDGRLKPDISGPTNVRTSADRAFGGTSAAAPHISGAAALVLSARPLYSADQLQQYLESNVIDLGEAGKDNLFGVGALQFEVPQTVRVQGTLFAGTNKPGAVYRYAPAISEWRAISPELGQTVLSMAEYSSKLYAGVKTTDSKGRVYRWDKGRTWTQVGQDIDSRASSLIVWNGALFAGTSGNGAKLYRYNEQNNSWDVLLSLGYAGIRTMEAWNGKLYLGDDNSDTIWQYDGTTALRVMAMGRSCIWDFEPFNDKLYASAWSGYAYYSSDGEIWNDWSWSVSRNIWAIKTFQGNMYAGMDWVGSGAQEAQLWKYDGFDKSLVWATPVDNRNEGILSLTNDSDNLFMGLGPEAGHYSGTSGEGEVYAYNETDGARLISDWLASGVQTLYLRPR